MPRRVFGRRIARSLAKDERKTAARYKALGKKYHIKSLSKAGSQESAHSRMFKRLAKMKK